MKKLLTILPLALILILAAALRLYHLGQHPPGLAWDEAALGYNAYSILTTARDEHGTLLPLIFKSFGDYKPGLYIYLTVPFIALFGLTEFATRLPSALAGTLAVWGIFLLVNQLFSHKRLGLIASFLLAISPWHLFYSRGAWEVNLFLTLLIFALYFFLHARKSFPFYPSLILATLTLFVYQGAKLLTALSFLAAFLVFLPHYRPRLKKIFTFRLDLIATLICALVALVLLFINLNGPAGNRLKRLSIFNYRPSVSSQDVLIDDHNRLTISLFHSNFDLHPRMIISRFLYHFSPEILFYHGPQQTPRGHIPNLGLMYLFDALLLILGLKLLVTSPTPSSVFLFVLLLITTIPGSLTLAEFSSTRSLPFILPLIITAALGLHYLLTRPLLLPLLLLPFFLYNLIYGLDLYFNHSQSTYQQELNAAFKPAIAVVQQYPQSRVIMTDVYGQPYIYYLFYTRFDPAAYQKSHAFVDGGVDVGKIDKIGRLEFHQFGEGDVNSQDNTIFIGTEGNLPRSFDLTNPRIAYHQDISFANNLILRIVKTK